MRHTTIIHILAILALPLLAPAQETGLPGLWKVVSITNLDTGGRQERPVRQFHMFTASHHMIVLAGENRKTIAKSFADMTAAEVMSQLPAGAGFYRYKISGAKLIRTNILALSAYYEGKTFETGFKVDGDTLTLRDAHAADGHLREWKLKRVE